MPVRKKAVATRKPSGALTLAQIKKNLSTQAAAIKDKIGSANEGRVIRLNEKVFTFPDGTVVEPPMDVVIVDFTSINRYWPGVYNSNNPEPPVCYALGDDPRALVPSDKSSDKQAASCSECPMNEFGSSNTGAGKACKNARLLTILPPDAGPDDQLLTIEVSPTALKNFDGYVNGIVGKYDLPPIAVVTTISFHPELTYPSLLFSGGDPNPNLQAHYARLEEARSILTTEPDYASMETQKPARGRTRARATRRK